MTSSQKIEAYFALEHPMRNALGILREIAEKTSAEVTFKWGAPVYTINNKNIFAILRFKSHFGIWFYNGVYLTDPKNVLENAQDGKTKAMRHWKFYRESDIDRAAVLAYIKEAIENQEKGMEWKPERKSLELTLPPLLSQALNKNKAISVAFEKLTPYKKREYCEFISEAKLVKTKESRLEKIMPLISKGMGLNDKYKT
jgi:uncharacterized protein YdeI (YjbR/CyaY-like superfamily)